ncbi:hypothetical protein NBRC110019_05540 [Neptunitalea chrysea]|uniref:Rhodanese domain-containing protein n=1 Tax=Neptunitalea chrysea TaxID=1647581 RepID=A0A9W6ETA4_9FLAO|nr:rhodanese-like domain-containing protein [Neptunitalea chrysea]GLB51515.1 hypothetical protein NBRC110019_05540 [Neptunitalea chrysea]
MKPIYLGVFLVLLMSCSTFYQDHVTLLEAPEFQKQISESDALQLIDVRTLKEFKEGAITGAVNMNLNDDDFQKQLATLDKEKPVYVYCRTGIRSKDATIIMAENGFEEIYELSGGYRSYKKD